LNLNPGSHTPGVIEGLFAQAVVLELATLALPGIGLAGLGFSRGKPKQ